MTAPQCRPALSAKDQTLHRLAFQHPIHSTLEETFSRPLPNGQSTSSSCEQFPAVAFSEQFQAQDVSVQEAIELPLHDGREIEIRGSDSVGGIELPCLSSFESHIKQLGKLNYFSICSRSNYKCIEDEYDLDYPIDDQESNDAWRQR
jgi:hypothetical protein